MSLTRNTINGGWLEEVTITPDGEDGDDDDEDYFCGFCAQYVPYGHICSEDEEVEEIPSGVESGEEEAVRLVVDHQGEVLPIVLLS